jgi:transcriptional regulator with PAS, ATPase and Fis domain
MRQVLELATMATHNDSPVLINGETGVGKGVLARWIQEHSNRAHAPFVEVNCSSLRGELLSSELFGHTRGAFTSAVENRQGLIEVADGGTLFLDEIGDMDPAVQAQFLKVIEEKQYRRLGEVRVRTSEFRLICATNQNLEERVQAGLFRRDLFFRINVFRVTLPALRSMPENLPGLVNSLLRYLTPRATTVDPAVYELMAQYPWPGNVRELRNVLERALVLSAGQLTPDHFKGLLKPPALTSPGSEPAALKLADVETLRIREAMTRFDGDTRKAADALGISRATLYRRLKDLKQG